MKIVNPISSIENQLFKVVEHQLIPNTNDGNFENPTVRGLYKSTGGQPLGVLGKNFNLIQPQTLFDNLIKCVGEIKNLNVDSLSYRELKGGSKIQFRVQLDPISFVNRAKKVDDIETFATLTTGYDGFTKTSFNFETFRLWCDNGCSHLDQKVSVSVKNTVNNETTIVNLCNDLSKLIKSTSDRGEWFKYLDGIDLNELKKQRVIKAAVGFNAYDKKAGELSKARLFTLKEIETSIEKEIKDHGASLWSLFNGITRYTSHGGRSKDEQGRIDYMFVGAGAKLNLRAERELVNLTK